MLDTLMRSKRRGSKRHQPAKAVLNKGFRPDIQGLRALAVLLVVSDHLFKWPAGGFIGVDVFFVLSGFLITEIMLREHEKTGRISFANFYRRRARRIMPVAVLVLLLTVIVSALLFVGERSRSVALDGLWALLFASNWRFASIGTDYLQADGPVSPLQHYWSLAVEEQFYVVWPVLLVLLLVLVPAALRLRARQATRILVAATVLLIVVSFAFAIWETRTTPTVAYFSTFARAWELGIGALLAIGAGRLASIPARLRPAMQWSGIVGVIASAFVIGPTSDFPGPTALLPVVSAALIVVGGISAQSTPLVLTNPVARYIGDISYSLYLWHFPVIIFLGTVYSPSLWSPLVALIVMGLLSALSYHFLEDPIRKSQWLSGKRMKPKRRPFTFERKHGFGVLAAVVIPLVIVSGLLVERDARYSDTTFEALPPSSPIAQGETAEPPSGIEQEVSAALAADTFPALNPAIEDLGRGGFQAEDSQGCAPATPQGKDCSALLAGNPAKTAIVLGDSMAIAWLPSIRAALEPQGWTVESMTYVGCPFIASDTVAEGEGITASCPGHKQIARDLVTQMNPGLVIVSNAYGQRIADNDGEPSLTDWTNGASDAHTEWLAGIEDVATIESPPAGANPTDCFTRLATPQDCVAQVQQSWRDYTAADKQLTEDAGHLYIPTSTWFCGPRGCPMFVGDTVVRRDASHMTPEYGAKVAPFLSELLRPALGT